MGAPNSKIVWWENKAPFYARKERNSKITPKPGQIYTADLGLNVGSEINGVRPFVVLSATTFNNNSGTVTGIPLSKKEFATVGQVLVSDEVLLDGNVSGVIKTEMITTISKGRIGDYIGRLNEKGMREVKKSVENFLVPFRRKH